MIEVVAARLVADDPIYEVLPAHVELLTTRGSTQHAGVAYDKRGRE
jgi:hypothetical protein